MIDGINFVFTNYDYTNITQILLEENIIVKNMSK